MTRSKLLARSGAVLMTVGALATGCSSVSTSSPSQSTQDGKASTEAARPGDTASSSSSPAADAAAPEVGECRALGYAEISDLSDVTRPKPCAERHTTYTFAVGTLPDDIAFTGVSIENRAVQDAAAANCRTAFSDFIGGDGATRALSRLTVTYFLPDQGSFDAGAHWVRCDVVAMQSEMVLAGLPRELEGFLDDERHLEQFGVCSKGEPGSEEFKLVMCTQQHAYRALAALRLGTGEAAYPGRQVTKVEGQQWCEAALEAEMGSGGGYTYGWTYPTPRDWDGGQRFGYCWHRTVS